MPNNKMPPPAKRLPTPTEKLTTAVDTLTELLHRLEPDVRKNGAVDTLRESADTVKDTLAKATGVTAERLKEARGAAEEVAATLVKSNSEIASQLVESNKTIAGALTDRNDNFDDKLDAILNTRLPGLDKAISMLALKMNIILGGMMLIFPAASLAIALHYVGLY
jgi:uncharacterized phage infection (PIP) family protein YhgE